MIVRSYDKKTWTDIWKYIWMYFNYFAYNVQSVSQICESEICLCGLILGLS